MKNIKCFFIVGVLIMLLSSCEYDNFDGPNATLKGRIVYENQNIGVRTNGPKLELWQDGYALKKSIPIYIAQDGTFSANLFKGQYKLVRKADAPWLAQLKDTIIVDVKGTTELDVEVTPYFIIKNEKINLENNQINIQFEIKKIVESAHVSAANIYFDKGILTDHNRNESKIDIPIGDLIDDEPILVQTNISIPEKLKDENYIFIRIGVLSDLSSEYYYTQSRKIELK